ncbi:MAG: hypothetical protein H6729_11460 [Deltaproteobacteria bacterium]|nr:hypothetical protein [Deltaproteobacteria bacterium]
MPAFNLGCGYDGAVEARVAKERGVSRAGGSGTLSIGVADALEDLVERAQMLSDLFVVVSALSPEDAGLAALSALESSALDALRRAPSDEAHTQIHHALLEVERRLLDIEGAVSRVQFAQRFDPKAFSVPVLLHYVKAMARRGAANAERPARIRDVLGHLLLRHEVSGQVAIAERADVDYALSFVFAGIASDEDFRDTARKFFIKASDRLCAVTTLDEVFESGLYADITGFEIALRERLLDPDVLWGSLRLATFLSNRLRDLANQADVGSQDLFSRMLRVRGELEAIFGEAQPAPATDVVANIARSVSRTSSTTAPKKERKRTSQSQVRVPGHTPPWFKRARTLGWGFAVVAALGISGGVYQAFAGSSAVGRDVLTAISPQIVEAHISNASPRTLYGVLDENAWRATSKDARRQVALQIQDRIGPNIRVQNAVLKVGDHLAIQIEGSRLKYVQ